MNGEYISLETAKKTRRYNILLRRIKILKKENIKRKNIIKEVREYIDKFIKANYEDVFNQEQKEYMVKILEILDKENK